MKYKPNLSEIEIYGALIEIENGTYQEVLDLLKETPSIDKLKGKLESLITQNEAFWQKIIQKEGK